MKKINIDWKSKILDLFIVIIGISIAFQLNNWNESNKLDADVKDYISSFYEETKTNEENLTEALNYSNLSKKNLDTLKQILLAKNYNDERILSLSTGMMGIQSANPSTTTMENIKASGEFELIKNVDLRKKIISTYNHYNSILKLENILYNYVNDYVTPYFFNNLRISDLSGFNSTFIRSGQFENIVFGYQVLINQQIAGYQEGLNNIKSLKENLKTFN